MASSSCDALVRSSNEVVHEVVREVHVCLQFFDFDASPCSRFLVLLFLVAFEFLPGVCLSESRVCVRVCVSVGTGQICVYVSVSVKFLPPCA